jgi:hypothetical protein
VPQGESGTGAAAAELAGRIAGCTSPGGETGPGGSGTPSRAGLIGERAAQGGGFTSRGMPATFSAATPWKCRCSSRVPSIAVRRDAGWCGTRRGTGRGELMG